MLKFNLFITISLIIGLLTCCLPVQAQNSHIVINEIQLAGLTSKDEFVELYNPTDQNINLAGWRLTKKTQSGNEYNLLTSFPDIIIPVNSYLLIAHQDFQGKQQVDVFYSTSSSMANNNSIILYSDNGQTVVDKMGLGETSDYETAPTINPGVKQSINRINNQDTNNNLSDFSLSSTPTPKAPNQINQPAQELLADEQETDNRDDSQTSPPASNGKIYSNQIIINELLPNPIGKDEDGEWIELKNLSRWEVDLEDWKLGDNSSYLFTFTKDKFTNTTIAPDGYFVIKRSVSKIALNNNGDCLKLYQPNESLLSEICYDNEVIEGASYARDDKNNDWFWTTSPTLSASNLIALPTTEDEEENIAPDSYQDKEEEELLEGQKTQKTAEENAKELKENIIYSNKIIINELLPNPIGKDENGEWIELKNLSQENINLESWIVADTSRQYQIKKDNFKTTIIAAGSLFLIPRQTSKLALNNSGGDSIKLYQPNNNLLEEINYNEPAKEGLSYARDEDDGWFWTINPTPEKENIIKQAEEVEENKSTTKKETSKATVSGILAPEQVKNLALGSSVKVQGIVIVEPNVLSTTYFYINGLQIYCYYKDFPELKIGDLVEVSGEISSSSGEIRLKIKNQDNIKVISHDNTIEVQEKEIGEIQEENRGQLVKITGEILEIKSNTIYLDDGSDEIPVYIKANTAIDKSYLRAGDNIVVQGIVSQTKSGLMILPRQSDDIKFITSQVLGSQDKRLNLTSSSNSIFNYLTITLIALFITGLIITFKRWSQIKPWFKKISDKIKNKSFKP